MAQIEENKYQRSERLWLECMERIGRKELAYFEEYSESYAWQIVNMKCRREIMCWVYSELKKHKKIKPIENLEPHNKKSMWGFVLEICNGVRLSKEEKIQVAKTFYVIEYFLNERELGDVK